MIGAGAVLRAWEQASRTSGNERALVLTACAAPGAGDPSSLTLGRRDAVLLRLYRELRGPVVEALATCPRCESTLDVHLPVADLIDTYSGNPASDPFAEFSLGTTRVRARCPNTADLIAVAMLPDTEAAALALLDRCVERVVRVDGSEAALDADERAELGACLERLDPLVDTRIDIVCGDCGLEWPAFLDVPDLAWSQVLGRGRRLLREVDALAARYGWSEAEILSLSETRRTAYLDLG
jgi:hypothetical protein